MGNVGGDPTHMQGGAKTLTDYGQKVRDDGQPVIQALKEAGSQAGHDGLSSAAARLGAALGTTIENTGDQSRLAAQLAANASDDLRAATGS